MIPVSHAVRRVLYETRECFSNSSTERIPIEEGIGRICAETIQVPSPGYPPYRASIMDGYGLYIPNHDISSCSSTKDIIGYIHAGDTQPTLTSAAKDDDEEENNAVYITTGAMVPEPYNVVVPIESVTMDESSSSRLIWKDRTTKKLPAHYWIRQVGCDLPAGTIIVNKGDVLTHVHLALLTQISTLQHQQQQTVLVQSRSNIGLISTGTEVWNQQIPDANKIMLKNFLRSTYSSAIQMYDYGIFPDHEETKLSKLLLDNPDSCHIIITTGGISKGDTDIIQNILTKHPKEDNRMQRHFHQLFMKPGKPTTFATIHNTSNHKLLLFGLAGNPVSAMVCTHLFLQPSLEYYLTQMAKVAPEVYATHNSNAWKLDPQRPEYHRVNLVSSSSATMTMTSTGGQISSRLQSLCQAHGLAMLPQGTIDNQYQTQPNQPYPVILMNESFLTGRRIPFRQSYHSTHSPLTYTLLNISSTAASNNTMHLPKTGPSHENTYCVKSNHLIFDKDDDDQWKQTVQSQLEDYLENEYCLSDLLWIQVDLNFVQGLELAPILQLQKTNLAMAHSLRTLQQSALFSPMVGFHPKRTMMMVVVTSPMKENDSLPPPTMIPLFRHSLRHANNLDPF